MAKKKLPSAEWIMSNMDISDIAKMSKAELSKITVVLGSAVNKRYKRLEESGQVTPASNILKETGGKISVKNKNLNQIRREFKRAYDYMNSKTSTLTGYKKVVKETVGRIETKTGVKLSKAQASAFFKLLDKAKEVDPSKAGYTGDTNMSLYQELAERVKAGEDAEDIEKNLNQIIDTAYEERQAVAEDHQISKRRIKEGY